ncbi:MAG: VOC family protein [Novosphingobium sp.]|jgi:catechol 2,3-dioxygenase-like lactoylglutathione lyase family enzyme|nr:VOC family protein [Novosphingobium sp.]
MLSLPPRQVAYFVPDARAAALEHHRLFGSGPYFVADNIPLRRSLHRGVQRPLDHTSAYGQWGDIMIEFVQQNNPGPSPFHDVYPEGSNRSGIHHVALFVDDVGQELARLNASGFATALYAEMNDGFIFAFADTVAAYGHMLELYAPTQQLTAFYETVAQAAIDFDGVEPVRSIGFD